MEDGEGFRPDIDTRDQVYEAADKFLHREFVQSPEDLFVDWDKKYGNDPERFFDPKNLKELQAMPSVDRLYLLVLASRELLITPKHIQKYAKTYPDDMEAIGVMFEEQGGRPKSTFEHYLYSVAMPLLKTDQETSPRFNQYDEIAERRAYAPKVLMEGMRTQNDIKQFEAFGQAGKDILEALAEASQLQMRGDHFIQPGSMFGDAWNELSDDQKAALLRLAIKEIQRSFVFDEAFNSAFTKKRVEDDKKRYAQTDRLYPRHNVAHSIIFGTHQPTSVFDLDQSYFQREMDSTADVGGYVEEYPYHRLLLTILDRLKQLDAGKEETVDTVVDFWNKNRNPIFGNAVADLLSKVDPNRAAAELLPLLRAEKDNKNPLAAILYRLEFGRIGISGEGVRYLERMYDLGEHNNPKHHVERLTADGDVGIFDEQLELIRYFHLGDLSTPEKKVRAKVLEFSYETLFVEKSNETPQERQRRLDYLAEFQKHYHEIAGDQMFAQTGVRLNNLSFKEQGWFVIHFNEADEDRKDRLRTFVGTHGEMGLKAFFSLEYGQSLGDAILDIGENLPREAAETIFRKYGEISAKAEEVEAIMVKRFTLDPVRDREKVVDVTDRMLRRGKQLLEQMAEEVKSGKAADKEYLSTRLADLGRINADVILFANGFRIASEDKKLKIEDIEGVELASKDAKSLNDQEKPEMIRIFMANRTSNPEAYPRELLKKREKEFAKLLETPGKKFYLLSDDNNLLGFMHVEPRKDKKYLGSFNVDPEGRGKKIGGAFFEAIMDQEGRHDAIEIEVNGKNPWLKQYKETFGFQVVEKYTKLGQEYERLIRPPGGQRRATALESLPGERAKRARSSKGVQTSSGASAQ